MNAQMKQQLGATLKGLIDSDTKAAEEALHEYIRAKSQEILLGEMEDECDDENVDVKDGDDEEDVDVKASDEDGDDEEDVDVDVEDDDEEDEDKI